jgi:hypothetical protein
MSENTNTSAPVESPRRSTGFRDVAPLLFFGLVIAAVTMAGVLSRTVHSREAVHRAMVARDLLSGLSRGR